MSLTELSQVPKRKPQLVKGKKKPQETKVEPQPKKYNAFSAKDSQTIESAYQEILEETERRSAIPPSKRDFSSGSRRGRARSGESIPNTSIEAEEEECEPGTRVPVNEDFLFDVDIENRELAPAYWLGPIYDGTYSIQRISTTSANKMQYGEEAGSMQKAQPCALARRT